MSCAVERDAAVRGGDLARQHVDQGRLAGAVGADHRVHLAAPQVQVTPLDRRPGRRSGGSGFDRQQQQSCGQLSLRRLGRSAARMRAAMPIDPLRQQRHDSDDRQPQRQLPVLGQRAAPSAGVRSSSFSSSKATAPITAPRRWPRPPRMIISSTAPELCQASSSGLTHAVSAPPAGSPPGRPARRRA